ncbi:MAG: hypothetical protein IJS32_05865 [Kiritimatiellae bacterium]|nr:hypothetical protein [Kiritimatiellia bacterium]
MAFLSEPSDNPDEKRRRRVLLNLLDASRGIDAKNFGDALDAGLDFLAGKLALAALENRKVGYSPDQLADERRKSGIDTERIVEFEKDELVHQGSLRFIGWNSFDDAGDIKTRLDSIRTAISEDWIGFYRNLASRIPENKITGKLHVPCRKECIETWREKIFSDVLFVDALALWKSSPNASETIPAWVAHLVELLSKRKVENSTLKKVGGWMFLLQNNENRTPDKSIRLDWNETECKNRQKLSCGQVRWARWGWSWREGNEENVWYNVDDESWWNTVDPPRWTKIEGGEFVMMDRNEHERENRSLLKTATIRYNQTIWPWVESKTDGEWYNVNDTSWLSPAPNRYARGGDGQFVQLPDDEGSA